MIGVSVPALHKVFTGNENMVGMFSLVMNNNIGHNPCTIVVGQCWCRHVQICITGNELLDDIEDRRFRVLERLKESLSGGEHHDYISFGQLHLSRKLIYRGS